MTLLPPDFDARLSLAVQQFWLRREGASAPQDGTRGQVVGGKNLDGFLDLVVSVSAHCGLPREAVFTGKREVVLPGYFRPTKSWDALILHRGALLAVLEFKSQVGSFGNNFNNRAEEVLGSATDLWVAHRSGAFGSGPPEEPMFAADRLPPALHPDIQRDPRPPFLGWLMLMEDSPDANAPVRTTEPHYPVAPEFAGASYAQRYQLLCERMMSRRLYSGAALVLSPPAEGLRDGHHRHLSDATSGRSLFLGLAAKLHSVTG
ncbi:MAG: restriction endonuclease [Deltaproteobacteria bacterium]|nr:restriction endonuclease [Deltaproteobacteria bacterium]